jgi:hypothetical protein
MNPITVKIPRGRRITSIVTKEFGALPEVASRRFPRIMLAEAVRQTKIVVRNPAGRPCSVRFAPIIPPAMNVRNSRSAILTN